MSIGEKRTRRFTVRCTPVEHGFLTDRAAEEGLQVSVYLRRCGLGQFSKVVPPVNQKLVRDISLIGSNLNQIARRSNLGEVIDLDEIVDQLASLQRIALGGDGEG